MSLNEIIPPAFTLTLCESIGFETKSSFKEGIIPKNEFNKDSEHSLYTRDNWYAISSNRITIALIPMGNEEHAYIYSYSLKNNSVHLANKNIQIKFAKAPPKDLLDQWRAISGWDITVHFMVHKHCNVINSWNG